MKASKDLYKKIAIGSAIFIVLIIVLVLVLRKKKKSPTDSSQNCCCCDVDNCDCETGNKISCDDASCDGNSACNSCDGPDQDICCCCDLETDCNCDGNKTKVKCDDSRCTSDKKCNSCFSDSFQASINIPVHTEETPSGFNQHNDPTYDISKDTPIDKWDNKDFGDNFDSESGLYTVPVDGLYSFTINVDTDIPMRREDTDTIKYLDYILDASISLYNSTDIKDSIYPRIVDEQYPVSQSIEYTLNPMGRYGQKATRNTYSVTFLELLEKGTKIGVAFSNIIDQPQFNVVRADSNNNYIKNIVFNGKLISPYIHVDECPDGSKPGDKQEIPPSGKYNGTGWIVTETPIVCSKWSCYTEKEDSKDNTCNSRYIST